MILTSPTVFHIPLKAEKARVVCELGEATLEDQQSIPSSIDGPTLIVRCLSCSHAAATADVRIRYHVLQTDFLLV